MSNLTTINPDQIQSQFSGSNNSELLPRVADSWSVNASNTDLRIARTEIKKLGTRLVEVENDFQQKIAEVKEKHEQKIKQEVTKKDVIINKLESEVKQSEDTINGLTGAVTELGNEVQTLDQKNAELEEKKERLEKEILGLERKKAELEKENEKQKQKNKKLKQIFEKCNDYLFGVRTQRNVLLVAVVGIAFGYIFR